MLLTNDFESSMGLEPIYSTTDPDGNPATVGEEAARILRDNFIKIEGAIGEKSEEVNADGSILRTGYLSAVKGQSAITSPTLKLFTDETNNINTSLLEKNKVVKNGDIIIKDGQYLMADNGTVNLETGVTSEVFDSALLINAKAIDYNTGALIASSVSHSSDLLPIGNIIRIHTNQISTATMVAAIAFYDAGSNYLQDISVSVADAQTKDGIPDSRVAYYRVSKGAGDITITLYKKSTAIGQITNKDAITLITVAGGAYSVKKLQDIPLNNLMHGTPETVPIKGYDYLVGSGPYTNFKTIGNEGILFDNSQANASGYIMYNVGVEGDSPNFKRSGFIPVGNTLRIRVEAPTINATNGAAVSWWDASHNYIQTGSITFTMAHTQDAIRPANAAYYRIVVHNTESVVVTLFSTVEGSRIDVTGWGLFIYDQVNDLWVFNQLSAVDTESIDIDNRLVFKGGTDLSANTFRIPSIEITNKGTLLCLGEARYNKADDAGQPIEVAIKRSINNGTTWTNAQVVIQRDRTITNSRANCGSITVDRDTGRIYVFAHKINSGVDDSTIYTDGWWQANTDLVYVYSDDDGVTWSALQSIKTAHPEIYPAGTVTIMSPSSANGITMQDGTIVIPIQIRRTSSSLATTGIARFNSAFIYLTPADKKTLNWKRSAVIEMGWNGEPQLIEYEPGKLMINARVGQAGTKRRVYNTGDMGLTWALHPTDQTITAPLNNASIELMWLGNNYFEKRYYIYTNCDMAYDLPADQRSNPSVWLSLDLVSWYKVFQLYTGNVWGYTSIAYYDGKLVIAYETKTDIYATVINPYLLTGKYFQ